MKHKKLRPWIPATLIALLLMSLTSALAQRTPTGTNQVAFADFDSAVPGWDYGYFYSDGNIGGSYSQTRNFSDPPYLTNNVFRYTFDDTVFAGFSSWWGTGFGMPLPWGNDPSVLNSTTLSDYILSFDARVEGLLPGQTNAECTMEFRFGLGTGPTWVLVKALPYKPGTNWAHFVFTLDQGSFIGADGQPTTSYATFLAGLADGITEVRFNQNQDTPTEFGTDADNAIYMDNIKLEVIQYAEAPPPTPPRVPLTVFEYNMDDKGLWWIWPNFANGETTTGWSANANKATYWGENNVPGAGVAGSQALVMGMDNTLILTTPPGKPDWAGGNLSAGGPVDYSKMTSADLNDYRISFDARAEGLAAAGVSTPATFQFYFNAPDDTLQPPDADTDPDTLLRLNVNFSGITSNWQTFKALLSDGAVDKGSLANLQTHLSKINEISFQVQIQNPHNDAVWGTDADNKLIFDNIKFERLVIGTPPLHVEHLGNNVVVTWAPPNTGTVKLLSGSNLHNITNEVVGATSPYTNAAAAAPKFFRTLWVAPPPPTYTKLLILLPGETSAPGTATGKTGTPTPMTIGSLFDFIVRAVDNDWNPMMGITNNIHFTTTDPLGLLNNGVQDAALVNGKFTSALNGSYFGSSGTFTITVQDTTDPTKTSYTTAPIVIP